MSKLRSPIQVVLDTNVIVSALRSRHGASHKLQTLLGDGGWEINVSPALVLEYEEVAKRPAQQLWANPFRVEDILDYLCNESNKPRIFYTWRPTLPDPDDVWCLRSLWQEGRTSSSRTMSRISKLPSSLG
jgi:predicted nucleic acid-binding protein